MALRRKRSRFQAVKFRMTRAGWLFLGGSVLVGLAAVKSQAPLMLVLFGGMLGALHVSAILAKRMLSGVEVRREAPARVWQHRVVHVGYFLRNKRRRGSCLGLGLEQAIPADVESTCGYCAHLPAAGSFRAAARFAARSRGRFLIQGVRLKTSFPFGLVEAARQLKQESLLVVWPARGRLKRRLLRHGAVESSSSAPSGASGGQDEFFGLREYRDGDNPRWIHWRRSAGRSAPVVREMSRPLPEILWVILDTYQREASQDSRRRREKMIRFAGTLIDHAFSRQYKVGLATAFGGGVRLLAAGAGVGHRRDLLDALAQIGANRNWELADTAGRLAPRRLEQAQVVLVTPHAEALDTETILRIRAACRHLRVISADRLDHFFEDDPCAAAEDAECR